MPHPSVNIGCVGAKNLYLKEGKMQILYHEFFRPETLGLD